MDAVKPRERLLGPALRTQPDRRLVALARDGSTPAQEEIVRRYRAALVRFAGSIVGAAAAEDVVQEALTRGVAALAGADEDLRLRPWLYAIVRNTALNHLRDAEPATEQLDENYDGVEQPPQALERREGVRALFGGLRRLPDQQREAIVKRELEGRSHEEIAAELGVSSGAARQLIYRAREGLRVGLGSLLPMPLLRWLAEGGAGDAAVGAAAGAGGGALAAKAAVAVFAAGAAVTAGVAIDHGARQGPNEAPAAAVRPAVALPGGGGAATGTEPVTTVAVAEQQRSSSGDDSGPGSENSGPGSGSSGHGSGGKREDGDDHGVGGGGGPGPSAHSGPGRGGEESDDSELEDDGDDGHHSGHGGPGRSGGADDRSGSSHGGRGSGHGGRGGDGGDDHGDDDGGSDHSGSGGGDHSGGGEDKSATSGGGSSGSSSGSSGGSGGGDSGGDGDSDHSGGSDDVEITSTPTPPPAPEPVEESSSGSGSGGGDDDLAEESRDLSSEAVSQGSDDPD